MKQTKRIISLLLVLVMALGLFAGCGKKEEEKVTNKGPRKLVIGLNQKATIPDYETNAYTLMLERETGIDIEFFFFASSADHYKQQLTQQILK